MTIEWPMFGSLATSVVVRGSASIIFFFANDLLLAIYFIFILDSRNDVTQKANFFCWLLSVVYCQLLMASHRTCHLQDSHVLCKTC